mmetsp:Transcript_98432/g.205278  ORF Transcript_98432/g.205278 Transcript_98432/m.205278 type:complete len:258 (-) Transcript_98432:113-886(-)
MIEVLIPLRKSITSRWAEQSYVSACFAFSENTWSNVNSRKPTPGATARTLPTSSRTAKTDARTSLELVGGEASGSSSCTSTKSSESLCSSFAVTSEEVLELVAGASFSLFSGSFISEYLNGSPRILCPASRMIISSASFLVQPRVFRTICTFWCKGNTTLCSSSSSCSPATAFGDRKRAATLIVSCSFKRAWGSSNVPSKLTLIGKSSKNKSCQEFAMPRGGRSGRPGRASGTYTLCSSDNLSHKNFQKIGLVTSSF